VVSSEPATWGPGNHACLEESETLRELCLVHLKYFDFNFLFKKNLKWSKMSQSENEKNVCRRIGESEMMNEQEIYQHSLREINERYLNPRIETPAWLTKII
jgi:hypothetical protein